MVSRSNDADATDGIESTDAAGPTDVAELVGEGSDERRPTSRRRALGMGSVAGLIATVVMTAFRMPISHSLPPTGPFWAKYVGGGDPDQYVWEALALHLFYGTAGGAAFGLAVSRTLDGADSEIGRERRASAFGVAYGLLLSAFGKRVLLERMLDTDLDPDEALMFHLGHVVYGLTLGAWFGSNA